jgi:hypothetical protein
MVPPNREDVGMSKQLFAKFGVFALIVVNLGAYYVFWPENGSHGTGADKSDNVGNPMRMAASASAAQPGDTWKPSPPANPVTVIPAPKPAEPMPLTSKDTGSTAIELPTIPDPLGRSTSAAPMVLPALPQPVALMDKSGPTDPPKLEARADDPTTEQLKRLMDTFKKEPAVEPAPLVAAQAGGALPKNNPPTGGAPIEKSVPVKAVENSPWALHWEIAQGRTTLTAQLNKRLEFRIVGDRVKMETPDGAVVATGKVIFTGPNLKGNCERLTIGLTGESVTLEGKAELQIQQGGATDLAIPTVELRGEQFTLRLQQLTGNVPAAARPAQPIVQPTGILPASVNPATPSPFTVPANLPLLDKKGQ